MCGRILTKCTVPPLGPGTYAIDVIGEAESFGGQNRRGELVVRADGDRELACTLPPFSAQSLDGGKYSKTCAIDDDCRAIVTGDVCPPCPCPNAVIAKSESTRYEGDYRVHRSQCPDPVAIYVCGGSCPPAPKTKCVPDPVAQSSTCMLDP